MKTRNPILNKPNDNIFDSKDFVKSERNLRKLL